jgi:hypothetical protein
LIRFETSAAGYHAAFYVIPYTGSSERPGDFGIGDQPAQTTTAAGLVEIGRWLVAKFSPALEGWRAYRVDPDCYLP